MLVFPNIKINLGLYVTERRPDGYHNIQTVFYPVQWCDALELVKNPGGPAFDFASTGIPIDGRLDDNLVHKAWKLVSARHQLPPLKVHLHKHVPMGAGLGGGSSDAAFMINLLNTRFELGMSEQERLALASELGSDCAFFIRNKPLLAVGRGNEFSPIRVDLSAYHILVVYPNIHSNTRDAYAGLSPAQPKNELRQTLENRPVEEWKNLLENDFEALIFKRYPEVGKLKAEMYAAGAVYASMSGSGSAVYGIFKQKPETGLWANYPNCLQVAAPVIL